MARSTPLTTTMGLLHVNSHIHQSIRLMISSSEAPLAPSRNIMGRVTTNQLLRRRLTAVRLTTDRT